MKKQIRFILEETKKKTRVKQDNSRYNGIGIMTKYIPPTFYNHVEPNGFDKINLIACLEGVKNELFKEPSEKITNISIKTLFDENERDMGKMLKFILEYETIEEVE